MPNESGPVTQPILGNQAAPADVPRGETCWREDLIAYDALPAELRLLLQETPFEVDAAAVLKGYRQLQNRYGSELMAIAITAAEIQAFMRDATGQQGWKSG